VGLYGVSFFSSCLSYWNKKNSPPGVYIANEIMLLKQ